MVKTTYHHVAIVADDPIAVERWYTKYFGFRRARVVMPGPDQVVFVKRDDTYMEIFKSAQPSPVATPGGAGPEYTSWRHLSFWVEDVDAKLAELGEECRVTLGPLDFGEVIPGWKTAWVSDPAGNIVELSQGYVDEENPPPLPEA